MTTDDKDLVERLREFRAKATPGPWHAQISGKTVYVLSSERNERKPVVAWLGFDGCNRPLPEQQANVALIAEVPNMVDHIEQLSSGGLAEELRQRTDEVSDLRGYIALLELRIEKALSALQSLQVGGE
jgi:hypothetical protein